MEISLSNRQRRVGIDPAKLRRAAKKILSALGCKEDEVSIVIVDDAEITRLNRQYFRRSGPTNVISFPLQEGKHGDLQSPLLGDVVISADTAARHARAAGIRTGDEILFLLVHGVLHLAGYDHEGPAAERQAMEAKEREIFGGLVKGSKKGRKGPRGRGGAGKNRSSKRRLQNS